MNINDKLNLTIIDTDHFGRGIAKINNFVVFVNNSLKGDVVLARIIKINKSYAIANAIKILNRSDLRKCKICKYSDICNCSLIDMDYNDQLEFKKQKVKEIFKKITGEELLISDIIYDKNTNYRNKSVFHYKDKYHGFYKEETHDLINIEYCSLLQEEINGIYEIINHYGINGEVMIRSNDKKEIMIDFKEKVPQMLIDRLISIEEVVSIFENDELIHGKGFLTFDINNFKFHISNKSFFQVNNYVFSKTLDKIKNYLIDEKNSNLLDLYCGVGIIGLYVAPCVKQVLGIEIINQAIDDANKNKKINNISNIKFICGKVEDNIDQLHDVDIVIIDPPRRGLDKKTINNLLTLTPKKIIYLSCNINTLSRDFNLLKDTYKILEFSLIDMFPNTYHVESIVILEKNS